MPPSSILVLRRWFVILLSLIFLAVGPNTARVPNALAGRQGNATIRPQKHMPAGNNPSLHGFDEETST